MRPQSSYYMLGLVAARSLKIFPGLLLLYLLEGDPLPPLGLAYLAGLPDAQTEVACPASLFRCKSSGWPAAVWMARVPLPFWADAGGLYISTCRPGCTQICFAWCVQSLAASPQTPPPDRACSFMTPCLRQLPLAAGLWRRGGGVVLPA